jgi:4-hydroxythreonine-4-phosphate dehydrogenase
MDSRHSLPLHSSTAAAVPLLALTMGDPAGVGPELLCMAVQSKTLPEPFLPLLIGCPEVLQRAAALHGLSLPITLLNCNISPNEFRRQVADAAEHNTIACCNPTRPETAEAPPGTISAAAGDAAFRCLELAAQLALSGHADAIVTAPLNKEALHLAGHHYPGHTEILAERCRVREFAMMLHLPETALAPLRNLILNRNTSDSLPTAHGLSIAHVTLHTSVASVPQLLTADAVAATVRLMHDFLGSIGCPRRAIAVCALNPHGGEHGLFGDEESRIIEPGIAAVHEHCNLHGPLPADTAVRRAVLGEFDGLVAMYHDQGHIPVKLIGFDAAINITLGLPVIRTSPTHGTAFDIAWKQPERVNPAGFLEAMRMACRMSRETAETRP